MARHKCVGATNRMEYLCFVDENRYVCIYLFGGYGSYLQVRIELHDKNETLVSDLLKNDSEILSQSLVSFVPDFLKMCQSRSR